MPCVALYARMAPLVGGKPCVMCLVGDLGREQDEMQDNLHLISAYVSSIAGTPAREWRHRIGTDATPPRGSPVRPGVGQVLQVCGFVQY